MTTLSTTGVNWFIHETDQNGNMNVEEIDQKREKEDRKAKQNMLKINSCTENDCNYENQELCLSGLLHTFEKILPYNFDKTGYSRTLDFISKCFKRKSFHFN